MTHADWTIGLPAWALESADPRIAWAREQAMLTPGLYVREWFDEVLAATASHDLAYRTPEASRDTLPLDVLRAYAERGAQTGAMPSLEEIEEALGGPQPTPEDVVCSLEARLEQELNDTLLGELASRPFELGPDEARVRRDIDAIEELVKWAGRGTTWSDVPLADVLATIKAKWEGYTPKQRRFVSRLIGKTEAWETEHAVTVHYPRKGRQRRRVTVFHRRVSSLDERANSAGMQAAIEEALDRAGELEARADEDLQPGEVVQVKASDERQAKFLDWVGEAAQGDRAAKPWLKRKTYIVVLSHHLNGGGARNVGEAHQRAYAADTLRLVDRILGATEQGFEVLLNRQTGQRGLVPYEDARLAYHWYPARAKARLKQVHARRLAA